jgi:hypothetical protein
MQESCHNLRFFAANQEIYAHPVDSVIPFLKCRALQTGVAQQSD